MGTALVGGNGTVPQNVGVSNHTGMVVPRIGISFRADPKTVLRGGFGITVDPGEPALAALGVPAGHRSDP